MAFTKPETGDIVAAAHVNQFASLLDGTQGSAEPVHLTALNDATHWALRLRNLNTATSRALQVVKFDGTVLLQVDINGVLAHLAEGSTLPPTWQDLLEQIPALLEMGLGDLSDVDLTGLEELPQGVVLVHERFETEVEGEEEPEIEWKWVPRRLSVSDTLPDDPSDGDTIIYDEEEEVWKPSAPVLPASSTIGATNTVTLSAGWNTLLTLSGVTTTRTCTILVFVNELAISTHDLGTLFTTRVMLGSTESEHYAAETGKDHRLLTPHFVFANVAPGTRNITLQVAPSGQPGQVKMRRMTALMIG